MAILRDFYIAGALVISALLIGLSILCGLKAGYYEPSRHCSMSWSRPQYTEITQFTNVDSTDLRTIYPPTYQMHRHFQDTYQFIRANRHLHKTNNPDVTSNIDAIVIYLPGQSGSFLQIRSVASRILHDQYLLLQQDPNLQNNNHHENTLFLTFNFGNEWSSVSSAIISRQTAFVYTMLTEYLCHDASLKLCDMDSNDVDIILIGHSMGGIVATSLINILSKQPIESRSITPIDQFNHNLLSRIRGVVLISSPVFKPLIVFENKFKKFYKFHSTKFKQVAAQNDIAVLSVSGGLEDTLIDAFLSQISISPRTDFVVSDVCPSVMNTMDHQATVWCHATIETISSYILAVLRGDRKRNQYLYPFVPHLNYTPGIGGRTVNHTYGTKMYLDANAEDATTIIVSCSYPVSYLGLCSDDDEDSKQDCTDITHYAQTVPSWISHSKQHKFNFSLNHENHAFLQKFIAVINANDIGLKPDTAPYLRLKGSKFNYRRDRCVLWYGSISEVDHSMADHAMASNKKMNQYSNYHLENNAVYVDTLRLSPLMVHDIQITVTPPKREPQDTLRNDHLCVSGWSGMINAAGNGAYINKTQTGDRQQYYEQEQSYWYSPKIQFNRFEDPIFHRIYLYKHGQKPQTDHGPPPWAFGMQVGDIEVNTFCETMERNVSKMNWTPLDCKEWRILESNLNEETSGAFKEWRTDARLSVTDECSPYDVSLLHLSLNGDGARLYNQWVSLSTVHKETVHRMMVPRVNDEVMAKDVNNQLQFEWYLFDKDAMENDNEWIMNIEYNYLSSLINTIIRDFQCFPFIFVMSIWFGLIANLYNVEGVDLINFYVVIQCILMGVSCLDILPLNAHWRYVYVSWTADEININNYKPYLLEFVLPFIYYSTCSALVYVLYNVLRVVFRDIAFGFIQLIHVNELFVIPWGLLEYTTYVALVMYCLCGFMMADLNAIIKQQLIGNGMVDVEIHHMIVGVLVFVSMSNLLRKMCTASSSSTLFNFYERLLCIVVICTRWGLLFGVLEKQQYFELMTMCICFGMISYFEMSDITQYKDKFPAKALLSLCHQIYVMQRNIHKEAMGQTFVITPLLQSVICWAICKIFIKKFL